MQTNDDVNASATREIANRIGNLFLPLYAEEGSQAWLFPVEDADERLELDKAFGNASELWSPMTDDETVLDVFSQFCRLMPKLPLVQVYHEPDKAEFHWSRARCVLGGAGFVAHAKLADILTPLYPQCPLRTDETIEEWKEALATAHRVCGWPVTLALAEWSNLVSALQPIAREAGKQIWLRVVSLFHLLKHLRFSKTFGLVATYKNTAASFSFDDSASNILGSSKYARLNIAPALGCPSAPDRKSAHPLTACVDEWFRILATSDLLRRKTTSLLPGIVQHGPWSTLSPDPVNTHGFVQHGSRLTGVWLAQSGKVLPSTGETPDIVGYDWSLSPDECSVERRKFELALPTHYDASSTPFQTFFTGFPNINSSNFADADAMACLFDAVVCASMIRAEVGGLDIEKPLIMCMPAEPTLDESTNQGKSKAAHTIARAFAPGVPLIGVSDSDSAPVLRAIAATIKRYGTLCADEWRQPKSKGHILSHENLQLLITGGSVAVGEVRENVVEPLHLQHPLVVSCKAMDAPPDIINRSLIFIFDRLTDAQRSRGDILDEIESGKLALKIRLAALALCERLNLAAVTNAASRGSTNKGWRFNTLRAIAGVIWKGRHGADGESRLDAAIQSMQQSFVSHTREAEENGLLASVEEGSTVKVRLYSVFHELTSNELDLVRASCDARSSNGAWTPAIMLKARAELSGLGNRPFSMLCEHLCGIRARVSDRSVSSSLSRDIKGVMPTVGDEWVLPELLGMGGWRLKRVSDSNGVARVTLQRRQDRATPE